MSAILNNPILQVLGLSILKNILHGGILWIFYQLGLKQFRNLPHKFKHLGGLAALFLLFYLFLHSFFTQLTGYGVAEEPIASGIPFTKETKNVMGFVVPWISIIYLFLVTFLLLSWGNQIRRDYALIRRSFSDDYWQSITNQLSKTMNIKRPIRFAFHQSGMSPSTIGLWKPIILFPIAIVNQLTPEQVETIILHELTHIKRADFFSNFIISIIGKFLILNPFAHLFIASIRREAELSCDAEVVAASKKPEIYAESLFMLEKSRSGYQTGIAFTGTRGMLLERISFILGNHYKPVTSKRWWLILPLLLFVCFILNMSPRINSTPVARGLANSIYLLEKPKNTIRTFSSAQPIKPVAPEKKLRTRNPKPLSKKKQGSTPLVLPEPTNRSTPNPTTIDRNRLADWQAELHSLEKRLPPDPRDRTMGSPIDFWGEDQLLLGRINRSILEEQEIRKAFGEIPRVGEIQRENWNNSSEIESGINIPAIPRVLFINPDIDQPRSESVERIHIIIHSGGVVEVIK